MSDGAVSTHAAPGACEVDRPYLLALNVSLRQHDGQYWADSSWAKDLDKHLAYLPQLTLFCPVRHQPPDSGWRPVEAPGLRIVGFAEPSSLPTFLLRLPLLLPKLWGEVGRADIVHSGVAGWPIPLGWFCAPFARARGKKLVLIVESAFWRPTPGKPIGTLRRWSANVWEAMARRCLAQADYAAFTQPDYQRSLPAPRAGGGKIIQASWIDAADCIDEGVAAESWQAKLEHGARYLFASRMIAEKGTRVLAEALKLLARAEANIGIDIIGEGPELEVLRKAADTAWGDDHVRFLPPRPYGAGFLALVAQYHAVLVPSLSDEQPRIVYDAYSQAVPAIGSDLPGLRACVSDGESGRLVKSGSAKALADALVSASGDQLRAWGLAGLERAEGVTHDKLHHDRCHDLNAMFGVEIVHPEIEAPVILPEPAAAS